MGARATECCWICLQEDGELVQACACPRGVHLDCLAYWQLHSAGTAEELACRCAPTTASQADAKSGMYRRTLLLHASLRRFCSRALPNWKLTLSRGARPAAEVPVVAVLFGGCEWRLLVPPTPEGRLRFQRQVELLTGLPFQEQARVQQADVGSFWQQCELGPSTAPDPGPQGNGNLQPVDPVEPAGLVPTHSDLGGCLPLTLAGAHQVLLQDAYRWVAQESQGIWLPACQGLLGQVSSLHPSGIRHLPSPL